MSVWSNIRWFRVTLPAMALVCFALTALAAEEDFPTLTKRLQAEKPKFAQRQQTLLTERYDLADRPAKSTAMSRGKPVQDGVRFKLPAGMTWEKLAALLPEQVKEKQLWPGAAFFDGIPADAARKGTNVFERGSQVHFMAEFQALHDFPPAPKLNVFGKYNPARASESELRGQEIFWKSQCAICQTPPYYTDNLMHNLQVERFFNEVTINGRKASADGPIKTFPLRGIKDSPPYLHDDRLLTLEDTVEFFKLVLELKLREQEKKDLVAFMRVL